MSFEADADWKRALSLADSLATLLDRIDKLHRPTDVDELDNCRSAIHSVMGERPKFVNDDGTIWPMVPGDEFWVGPLRIKGAHVEQLRYWPKKSDDENIKWVRIGKVT